MSDLLAKFGVDAAKVASLPQQAAEYPEPVPGRVAHIDADFMAYQVSAESKAELDPEDPTRRKTLEKMKHNAVMSVDHVRRLAAATTAVLHTTHNSNKGGREAAAIINPYQATRAARANKPEHLDKVREFLARGVEDTTGVFVGMNHPEQEADDGMAQAVHTDRQNAIVCSMDKDLLMVPGFKLNMYTREIYEVSDDFGSIWVDDTKSTKKVTGQGTKFFWAQLLMGDTADNISGVPACPGSIWQEYAGTNAYKDTVASLQETDDPEAVKKLEAKLEKLRAKPKKCGPMLTHAVLEGAEDDRACYKLVRSCYELLHKEHGFTYRHWNTGAVVTPTQALFSEMKLLWMRRTPDENDVLHWLKEVLQ